MEFEEFAGRALTPDGEEPIAPYTYQSRLAAEGLPELLRAPTGSGKSAAAVLPWLWRRLHGTEDLRATTPGWLVIAQPLRTLVDQLGADVRDWLQRLGLTDKVDAHVLLGGRPQRDDWRLSIDRTTIVIGSVDMLLSRALNRGYASSRYAWPIEFGLLNNNTQWIFDEVQLLGPALPTSRQLQAFRTSYGTWRPTSTMWMSATVDPDWLTTVDAPTVPVPQFVGEVADGSPLAIRLHATRRVTHLQVEEKPKAKDLAASVVDLHRGTGTRTLVFCNTVARAQDLYTAVGRAASDLDLVLVHSRFRALDRQTATSRATNLPDDGNGQIVITTQAMEAGVDITSHVLITELAPWASIVQRAGRCNRDGLAEDARLVWFDPGKPAPYDEADLDHARQNLEQLDERDVTGGQLADLPVGKQELHPVLRRRDLDDLFDTLPDLTGSDTDVSPYIRDAEERDVFVAWRQLPAGPLQEKQPRPEELCRVSIAQFRTWTTNQQRRWFVHDHLDGRWRGGTSAQLHPGITVLVDRDEGGYDPIRGWVGAKVKQPVAAVVDPDQEAVVAAVGEDGDITGDTLSHLGRPVLLDVHLRDTRSEADRILDRVGEGLPTVDVTVAGLLHDIGKVHPEFQWQLHVADATTEQPQEFAVPEGAPVLAKSAAGRGPRSRRTGFRHEVVSLAMLRTPAGMKLLQDLDVTDPTLVQYLVGAHHGRARVAMRALPSRRDRRVDWESPDGATTVFGVAHGEQVPEVEVDGRVLTTTPLDVDELTQFAGHGWSDDVARLRTRPDLGPFRLAYLEAVVRLADWRASARPSEILSTEVPT